MSVAEELTFHLEDFDGPLELLLALVAKHKMDLHNIPILELIDQYTRTVEQAKAAAHHMGVSPGIDPFMTLSFMSLPVIPALKITTHGVFDVEQWKYI